jgi:hypothetical protein
MRQLKEIPDPMFDMTLTEGLLAAEEFGRELATIAFEATP